MDGNGPHKVCDVFGRVTREEGHAREILRAIIRGAFLSGPPFTEQTVNERADEWTALRFNNAPVSETYAVLDKRQRDQVRDHVENPGVRSYKNGRELFITAHRDLLDRLERGVFVGAVDEKQVKRQVGDKAF